jgi:colicin import membrane protein
MVPGGDVVSVKVVESSGDARFDRQAEIAAKKASPLPVPDDIKIFNKYLRTVRFRFNPG